MTLLSIWVAPLYQCGPFSSFPPSAPSSLEDTGYTEPYFLSQSSREEEAWLEARAYRQEFSSCPGEGGTHLPWEGLWESSEGSSNFFLLVPEEDQAVLHSQLGCVVKCLHKSVVWNILFHRNNTSNSNG